MILNIHFPYLLYNSIQLSLRGIARTYATACAVLCCGLSCHQISEIILQSCDLKCNCCWVGGGSSELNSKTELQINKLCWNIRIRDSWSPVIWSETTATLPLVWQSWFQIEAANKDAAKVSVIVFIIFRCVLFSSSIGYPNRLHEKWWCSWSFEETGSRAKSPESRQC